MLKLYEEMGANAIYQCTRGRRINHLEQIADELEEDINVIQKTAEELMKRNEKNLPK